MKVKNINNKNTYFSNHYIASAMSVFSLGTVFPPSLIKGFLDKK